MELPKRPLDESVTIFLRDRLGASGPLGSRLAATELEAGTAFTFAAMDVSQAQLHAFSDSGVAPQLPLVRVGSARAQRVACPCEDQVVSFITTELSVMPGAGVVAEEGWSSPTDPWLKELEGGLIQTSALPPDDVFLSVAPSSVSEAAIAGLLQKIDSFAGFVVICGPEATQIVGRSLATSDLDRIAATTRTIVVPAYDAEGYVIWTRGTR